MTNQHQSQSWAQHYHKERPVELPWIGETQVSGMSFGTYLSHTIKSSSDGVESKHDEDDHVGDEVGEHLETQESVYLLTGVVQVTVDAPQYVELYHDGGLLISRNLRLVALNLLTRVDKVEGESPSSGGRGGRPPCSCQS